MNKRILSRSVAAFGLCSLIAACASAPTVKKPAPLPSKLFEFTLPDSKPKLAILKDNPEVNGAPIHIWVHKHNGKPHHIRVVGHANAEVCHEVSQALVVALASPDVDGFLTFGVGDLRPARDLAAFARAVAPLLAQIETLAKTTTYVQLHQVGGSMDESLTPIELPSDVRHAVAVATTSEAPLFLPVRAWTPGTTPTEISFRVTWGELGLSTPAGRKLGASMSLAPWIEAIEHLQLEVQRLSTFLEWRRAGKRLDPEVFGIRQRVAMHSPIPMSAETEVKDATVTLERAYDAAIALQSYERVAVLYKWPRAAAAGLDDTVRELELMLDYNRACLVQIRAGYACSNVSGSPRAYFNVTIQATQATTREFVASLEKMAASIDLDDLAANRDRLERDRIQTQADVARMQQDGVTRLQGGRERVVDGLLRGWSIPTSDKEIAAMIDSVVVEKVPEVWRRIVNDVRTRTGAAFAENPAGNRLIDPHVFFDVREVGPDTFEVRPRYVVRGRFMEVWDPNARTITVAAEDVGQHEAMEEGR